MISIILLVLLSPLWLTFYLVRTAWKISENFAALLAHYDL